MIKKTMSVIGCVAILGGCTSLTDLMTSNINATTGAPSNFGKVQKRKVEKILNSSVREINTTFIKDYQSNFSGAEFKTTLVPTSDGYKIKFNWTSPKGFFPPGEYNIKRIPDGTERSAMAFLDLVVSGITGMANDLDEIGEEYELHATYHGVADGLPIKGSGILYRNEYGTVVLPKDVTILNGKARGFIIRPFDKVNNQQLAALRAYSMRDFVQSAAPNKLIGSSYRVSVVPSKGIEHRAAWFDLKLRKRVPGS